MMLYRILFGIDILAAAVAVFFFLWGITDGTVSSFNILIWMLLLGGIGAVLGGGWALKGKGLVWPANGLLMFLAFPAFMIGLFFAAVMLLNPRWN